MTTNVVVISCPHCYGTGRIELPRATKTDHCVFCDGAGELTVNLEMSNEDHREQEGSSFTCGV